MNKTPIATLLGIALLLAYGCKSIDSTIQDAAYGYLYSMANYDIDSAEPYADSITQETTIGMARMLLPMVDTNYIKSDTPATIEIESVDMIDDTTAQVAYHKKTPIKDFHDTVSVVLHNGRWLVHTPTPVIDAALPQRPSRQRHH